MGLLVTRSLLSVLFCLQLESLAGRSLNDLLGQSQGGLSAYMNNMAADREWGDGSMLSIASIAYERQIKVYLDTAETSLPVKLCSDNEFKNAEPLRIGYLAA